MKLNPDSLLTHLEQQLLPVYLVSGDEPLLTGEAADAIRARARAAGFTERETHFMDRGADWNTVRGSASTMSLFAERRVIELRLSSAKPGVEGNAAMVSLINSPDRDRLLLILAPRLDRDAQGADWVRAAEANGAWVTVWPVDADRMVSWLGARCRRAGLNVSQDALELLAERTEGNLLAAHQEIEMLRLLASGGQVTAEDVLASVADSARFDVYQLTESTLLGDGARALRVLSKLRTEGVDATLALWALSKAVRDVWAARQGSGSGQRARTWSRQAAALDKAVRRASRMPFARLTMRAARADRMIKGREKGDPWDELALLAADLAGRPALPVPQIVLK